MTTSQVRIGRGQAVLILPDTRAVAAIYQRYRRRQTPQDDLCLLANWATLLEAGTPLAASLRRLGATVHSRTYAVGLTMLADGVERGYRLSDMLGAYPQVLPSWWGAFIALGEQGGELPRVLRLLHRYITERLTLRQQFLSAFITPALTAAAGLLVVGLFLFWFLPRLIDHLVFAGVMLPAPLAWYVAYAPILWWWATYALALGVLWVLATFQYFHTSRGRVWLDRFRLKAPIFGVLVCKYELLRLVHGMKVLIGQGTSLPAGIESLAKSSSNVVVQQALYDVVRQIDQGIPLDLALATIPVIPPEGVQIIATGWVSGHLEEMLDRYLERLAREVIFDAKEAVKMVLRLTMMVIAIFVTLVLLAFYLTFFMSLIQVRDLPQTGS